MAAAPVTQKSASVEPEGARLANRIVGFARMLRRAGLRIGPAAVMDAVRAVLSVGIENRSDFYWTLHSTMISRREDHAVFDAVFRLYWARREDRDDAVHQSRTYDRGAAGVCLCIGEL